MAEISGSFTIKIPGTKDLQPPELVCNWKAEFEGDPKYEKALLDYFKAHYEAGLKKIMGDQTRNFAVPLASMQKSIDEMRSDADKIHKLTDAVQAKKAMEDFAKKYDAGDKAVRIADYHEYLVQAVENVRKQQLLIYADKFEKEANAAAQKGIKTQLSNKKARHIIGVVIKGALVLGVAAAAIAAAVASFGAAAVAIAAVGAVAAGLGGLTALGKTGKSIYEIRDLERRSLKLLFEDIEAVNVQLGKAEGQVHGLSKRVNDVSAYYTRRKNETKALGATLKDAEANLAKLSQELVKLQKATPKLAEKKQAEVAKAQKALGACKEKYLASAARDTELMAALDGARKIIEDLNRIPFEGAKSVLSSLKRVKPESADDVFAMVETLGSLAGAAGGVAGI